jgi:hypothetical protein
VEADPAQSAHPPTPVVFQANVDMPQSQCRTGQQTRAGL